MMMLIKLNSAGLSLSAVHYLSMVDKNIGSKE
jgi:hypothetical protein